MYSEEIFSYRGYDIIYNGYSCRVPIDDGKLKMFDTE